MNPSNTHSSQISDGSYFTNPTTREYTNKIINKIDEMYSASSQAMFLVENGNNLISTESMGNNKIVQVWNWGLHDIDEYDYTLDDPMGVAKPINRTKQPYAITRTAKLNASIDDIERLDSGGILEASTYIRMQTKHRLTKMYDANILGNVVAVGSANGYSTSLGSDPYTNIITGKTAYDKRTENATDACLVGTQDFWDALHKDAKFVRDNEVAQKQQVYKGAISMVLGMPFYLVDVKRFGSTARAMIVSKNIAAFVRKAANFRIIPTEKRFGRLIQYRSYFDTIVPKNAGVACQLLTA